MNEGIASKAEFDYTGFDYTDLMYGGGIVSTIVAHMILALESVSGKVRESDRVVVVNLPGGVDLRFQRFEDEVLPIQSILRYGPVLELNNDGVPIDKAGKRHFINPDDPEPPGCKVRGFLFVVDTSLPAGEVTF